MEILHRRRWYTERSTIGVTSVDGVSECFMLEDRVRTDDPATVADEGAKVYGRTAIPAGRYRVVVTYSQRFQRRLPELLGVPGFKGIRIHPGNTDADTEGCPLPGVGRGKDVVYESRRAFESLFAKINKADECWITIVDEREEAIA